MSVLSALAYDLRSFRLARDVIERGESNVFTAPWWRPFSYAPPTQEDTRMDPSTAEAISVMERQLAEKDQRIAALESSVAALQRAANDDAQRLAVLERAATAFSKGLVR